jgi:hypothetical protein
MFFLNYNNSIKNRENLTEEKKDFFNKIQNMKNRQKIQSDNSLNFKLIKNNQTRINNETKIKNGTKNDNLVINALPDIYKSKIGIIYVYYERKNEQKNQTNLSFFIKYGLNNNLWSNLDISTLFVINGHQCEVLIPKKTNIYVLKEDNCSDWEGWYNGIKYFEKMKGKKIWEIFDYLCLINAGAIGPIYEENQNDHWLNPFYQKMVKDNAVICSPCMSFLPITHPGGPGPKVVPIFTLMRCTKSIIHLLTNVQISCTDKLSKDTHYVKHFLSLYNSHQNTVFGKKKDKTDAALTGEYGLSRILIDNGYRVTSLLYNFDCHDPNKWKINRFKEPDRYKSFNGKNVPLTTIFIKNIWRSKESYVSLPVLYNECIHFVYSKLNMKSIFNNKQLISYNYNLLNYKTTGVGLHNSPSWNSKKDFYYKYGFAEESILFNIPSKNYNSCLIYAHYDGENIVKDYVIEIIKTFRYFGYDILFYTASKKINNINRLPCTVIYVNNEGPGTDWKIWLRGCISLSKNNKNYSHVFLLNDSIILPINGIENFGKTILNMRETSDFWGHWESNEIEWHLVGTPIEFKFTMIYDVINFINNSINSVKSSNNKLDYVFYVNKVEVKFSKYLVELGYKWNAVIKSDILDNSVTCPVFNPLNIQKWINNPMTFAIKWKYMISYLNKESVSPELNYLTRFLYYGKYGIISEAEKSGAFIKSV